MAGDGLPPLPGPLFPDYEKLAYFRCDMIMYLYAQCYFAALVRP